MVLTKERFDIKYALAEVVTDKRCVESLKWRSQERLIIWRKIITVIYGNFAVAKVIPVKKLYHEIACTHVVHGRIRQWRSFISPLNGMIKVQFLEVTSSGLFGCNLKGCSNGTHKGTIWHQIRISRSGDRQKMCWIVEVKITGKINYMKEDHHSYIWKFCSCKSYTSATLYQ